MSNYTPSYPNSPISLDIPGWAMSVTLSRIDERHWSCTWTGDQFRTGNPLTRTAIDADPQIAINRASNAVGAEQERRVAMGREVADAIGEVAP